MDQADKRLQIRLRFIESEPEFAPAKGICARSSAVSPNAMQISQISQISSRPGSRISLV